MEITSNKPQYPQQLIATATSTHNAAMEVSLDGIAVLEDDRFTYVNPSHAEMFGYSITEMLGQHWQILYSPDQIAKFQGLAFSTLTRSGHWRGEMLATHKDGSTFDQEVALSLLADGQLVCICRNISERKQTEAALAKSEEQFRNLVEDANDLIYSFNLDGLFTYISPQVEVLLGYQPAELMGRPCTQFTHSDDVHLMIADVQKILETGKKQTGLEIRILQKNGD
jgi:PAS domain S-box-containing protein